MKSYELIQDYLFGGSDKVAGFKKLIITPDPKREGLYKVSEANSLDGYKYTWSHLYGKCNQAKIQQLIKIAVEV